MRNFFINNLPTIAIIGLSLIYVFYLSVTMQWEILRKTAYKLMLKAEMSITGSKKGQERFDYVFQKFYSFLPLWVQFFYSPVDIKELLQEWFNLAKDSLDDGKLNNSIN